MFLGCGLSVYSYSLFHLINHAFFKALLFLVAGVIIHYLNNEQDIRKMGSLFFFIPFLYICFLIGSFSLMGFPFLSGFYSKDLIIEILYLNIKFLGIYGYLFSLVAATFTCLYSFRLVYCAFFTDLNFSYNILYKRHNFSIFIVCVLFFLLLGSIFSGYFLKDLLIGLGNNFLDSSIFILFKNYILNDRIFILEIMIRCCILCFFLKSILL